MEHMGDAPEGPLYEALPELCSSMYDLDGEKLVELKGMYSSIYESIGKLPYVSDILSQYREHAGHMADCIKGVEFYRESLLTAKYGLHNAIFENLHSVYDALF